MSTLCARVSRIYHCGFLVRNLLGALPVGNQPGEGRPSSVDASASTSNSPDSTDICLGACCSDWRVRSFRSRVSWLRVADPKPPSHRQLLNPSDKSNRETSKSYPSLFILHCTSAFSGIRGNALPVSRCQAQAREGFSQPAKANRLRLGTLKIAGQHQQTPQVLRRLAAVAGLSPTSNSEPK